MSTFELAGYQDFQVLEHRQDRVVYRAIRASDQCPVIVKSSTRGAHEGGAAGESLRREFAILQRLNTDSIVRAYALEITEDTIALVLEDHDGTSLDRRLQSGAMLDLRLFLRVAHRIAAALSEVHAHNVVHKDVKPANIVLNEETGSIKLIDFGIAAHLPLGHQAVDTHGTLEGTLPYVSPEQTGRMNRGIDFRSDLYSLGVTLYQMATGTLPFAAKSNEEWVYCHIARLPKAPCDVTPSVPKIVSDIVMRLLAKSADERYQSAAGLAHDLAACIEQWNGDATLEPFELGQRDRPARFRPTQRLFGREDKLSMLLEGFDRVSSGKGAEIVTISGYSGIGKSSLVAELARPVTLRHGLFIAGKFDQLKRDIPYATIVDALRAHPRRKRRRAREMAA